MRLIHRAGLATPALENFNCCAKDQESLEVDRTHRLVAFTSSSMPFLNHFATAFGLLTWNSRAARLFATTSTFFTDLVMSTVTTEKNVSSRPRPQQAIYQRILINHKIRFSKSLQICDQRF